MILKITVSAMIPVCVLLLCLLAMVQGAPPARDINVSVGGRIVNGTYANEGEFPYMAAVKYYADGGGGLKCGATILTPNWILTAAHCCEGAPSDNSIYTSSIYLSKGGKLFQIDKIINHPDFHGGGEYNFRNDICLIQLDEQIPLDNNTQQVILAPESTTVPDLSDVIAMGWGATENPSGLDRDRLQKVTDYKALSPEKCGVHVPDYPGQICATGPAPSGQATCSGDSGGPLIYNGAQVGLTSFGFGCQSALPDYFTRVYYYVPWIQETLGEDAKLLKFGNI